MENPNFNDCSILAFAFELLFFNINCKLYF